MNESTLVPREEMSDLDLLARNVHVWEPDSCDRNFINFEKGGVTYRFPRDQWLARRAELQNKPSWKDAPEWATHLAQHSNGRWLFMLSAKAAASLNGWAANRIWSPAGEYGEVIGDWRDTLEKRPEQKALDPFVSVEDAATAKQPAPKGSGNPILGMVLADLTNRALEGKEKYGEPLLAHNGRNPLWDAYQEALDLAMYLRQAIEEQK